MQSRSVTLRRIAAAGVVGLVTLATMVLGATPATAGTVAVADPAIGPNTRDEARYAHQSLTFSAPPGAPAPKAGSAAGPLLPATNATSTGKLRREVLGFAPYWAIESGVYKYWNYNLLSTVDYFGLTIQADGSINQSDRGWTNWNSAGLATVINAAHAAGDRVVVTIKALNADAVNSIVTSSTATNNVIQNVIAQMSLKDQANLNIDGLNIDFEGTSTGYPNVQSGMTNFTQQIGSAVRQRWPASFITIDTYSGSASWDGGIFKIDDLAPYVDAFFVMAYDMVPDFNHAGPNAPMNGWTYNDTTSVSQYLTKAPASKIILGVPYYGYKWCTTDTYAYAPATTVNGTRQCPAGTAANPVADPYSQVLDDFACAGSKNYIKLTHNYDSTAQEPWASWWSPPPGSPYVDPCGANHSSWRELYYDDAASLGLKYDLVNANNLRGTGLWALGYDGSSTDLWNELALKFVSYWRALSARMYSAPAVTSSAANRLDVFARGQDGALYERSSSDSGDTWNYWSRIQAVTTSQPAVVSFAAGRIDLFVRGVDMALYHRSSIDSGASWTPWSRIQANMSSAPTVTSLGANRLDVFARGLDNALYYLESTDGGMSWKPWSRIGANMSSDPAAVSSAAGRLDVFARGQDNALYLISSTDSGASWQPWQRLGGNLASAPAASSWGQGRLDVFALGRDLNVYHLYSSDGTSWQYWQRLGGPFSSAPAATSQGSGSIDLFARGQDLALDYLRLYIF